MRVMTVRLPARWRPLLRRIWPYLKFAVGLGLAAVALWAVTARRGELAGISEYLAGVRPWWIAVAAAAEFGSLVSFATLQRRLLETGGVSLSLRPLTCIVLTSTVITNSLPAGGVIATIFTYRQFRRRGADEAVAGWSLAATFVAASVSLSLVAAAGVAIAGAEGAGLDLVGVTIGVLVIALLIGIVFLKRGPLNWVVTNALRFTERVFRWPRGKSADHAERVVARLTHVTLSPGGAVAALGWGLANWLLDCGCLALSFLAVGVGVPWKGLLLAYGAGQLAANLPITPGGLGVVEGSLTIALVAFGGAQVSTVAAVLLYRILSFWIQLPIGWGMWTYFAVTARTRVPEFIEGTTEPDAAPEAPREAAR